MPYTNNAAVQEILGDNYDGATDLTPFVDTASSFMQRVTLCAAELVAAGDLDVALSNAELELMERWLAAHCYALMDQTYEGKATDGASGKFRGKTDTYLEATLYGQMAVALDRSECMMGIQGKTGAAVKATVGAGKEVNPKTFWLG